MSISPFSGALLGRFTATIARVCIGRRGLLAALKDAIRRRDDAQTIAIASRLLEKQNLPAADRHAALSARGRARLETGDFADALPDTEAAVAIDPASRKDWYNQGIARFKLRDFCGAAGCFDKAAAIAADVASQLWRIASYYEGRDWPAAHAAAEDLLRLDPFNLDGLQWRAHLRRRTGDREGALADLTSALDHAPAAEARSKLLRLRIALLVDMERAQEAIADCSECLALAPDDVMTIARRAELRERVGDIDGAIEDCGKIHEDCSSALMHLRLLVRKGDRAAALDVAKAALAHWPLNQDFMRRCDIERAHALIEAGDRPAARDMLNAALAAWPRDVELRSMSGALFLDAQQWRQAIADFDIVLRREPNTVTAWSGRAKADIALGKPYLALDDARHALALVPTDRLALDVQKQALANLNDAKTSLSGTMRSDNPGRLPAGP